MIEVDLHTYGANTSTALHELDMAIKRVKLNKEHIFIVIVGYGSSGGSHKIKNSITDKLSEYKASGRIKDYLKGEDCDIFNVNYQKFLGYKYLCGKKCSANKGIIYIYI